MERNKKIISLNISIHNILIAIIILQSVISLKLQMLLKTILLTLQQIFNLPTYFTRKCDYLPSVNIEAFFITSNGRTEFTNISFLNLYKSDGPNSIPT